MTHGSLFSGIGGFDLVAELAGWTNVFNCEIDPFCQKVLNYHFPNSIQHADIKQTDFTGYNGTIDVISGGFPCQPFSLAGRRKGTNDERYLWGEMLRAIREIQPRWVVAENVFGIINWSEGMVFEQVCLDLETQGYQVQPFVLPACGVNAPHRRYRVWFVATKNSDTNGRYNIDGEKESDIGELRNIGTRNSERLCPNDEKVGAVTNSSDARSESLQWQGEDRIYEPCVIANANGDGCVGRSGDGNIKVCNTKKRQSIFGKIAGLSQERTTANTEMPRRTACTQRQKQEQSWRTNERMELSDYWSIFPTQSPVCGADDGIPRTLDSITFPKWRKETIKAYGNAVVPQVVLQIFNAINQIEKTIKK